MDEKLIAALAAGNPQLKPLLAAMNGGGSDMSAMLPMLMAMQNNGGSQPQQNNGAAPRPDRAEAKPFPDDEEINMSLKRLN